MVAIWQFTKEHGGNFYLLNQSYITLWHKKERALDIAYFRPTSLVHGVAKIFSKALVCRLAPYIDLLIALSQSAFIRGLSMHDNFMFVSQSAKALHKRRVSMLFLKLDIARVFDSFMTIPSGYAANWLWSKV
jgi:hypothetical protein